MLFENTFIRSNWCTRTVQYSTAQVDLTLIQVPIPSPAKTLVFLLWAGLRNVTILLQVAGNYVIVSYNKPSSTKWTAPDMWVAWELGTSTICTNVSICTAQLMIVSSCAVMETKEKLIERASWCWHLHELWSTLIEQVSHKIGSVPLWN